MVFGPQSKGLVKSSAIFSVYSSKLPEDNPEGIRSVIISVLLAPVLIPSKVTHDDEVQE